MLFVLMLGMIVFNCIYANSVCNELYERTATIDISSGFNEQSAQAIDKLYAYWNTHKSFIEISVSHTTVNKLSDLILSLKAFYESHNISESKNAKAQLLSAISDLCHLDKFDLDNIL